MVQPKVDHLDIDDKSITTYKGVKSSVEEHLRKYEYMIPDIRKKKFEMLKQILGEKSFDEIQIKLERKRLLENKNNGSKTSKHRGANEINFNLNKSKEESPSKIIGTHRAENLKYVSHKGKLIENYQKLGGLGPNMDEKCVDVQNRRKAMIYFADKVNQN